MPADFKKKTTKNNLKVMAQKVLILELLDKRDSSWELEDSRNQGAPVFLDSANAYFIYPESKVLVSSPTKENPDRMVARKIRYIKGAGTIFVDEQKELGITPNPQIDNQDLVFEHGKKTVIYDDDLDINKDLYSYLMNYEGNRDNPNRPKDATPIFYVIDTEKKAEGELPDFSALKEAMSIMDALVTKVGSDRKDWQYDESRIDAYSRIFNLNMSDGHKTRLQQLGSIAQKDPELFCRTISDYRSLLKELVKKAFEMNVIAALDSKITWASGGVLIPMRSKKDSNMVEDVVNHLLIPENKKDYEMLLSAVDTAERKSVALQ